jgi:putative lipoic acid-binding regulatory protein
MTDAISVTIEFPCERYPIKVIGDAGEGFTALVIDILKRHAPDLDESTLVLRDSRNGKYQTVQLSITATGIEQLQDINSDLRATGRVHMVL